MHFGSDNHSGASDKVMQALVVANAGFASGYGADDWSQRAQLKLQQIFEHENLSAYFVTTGTAANSLAMACLSQPWNIILVHTSGHIGQAESTAPELFTGGARIVRLPTAGAKITADEIHAYFKTSDKSLHNAQASALSITQSSENGLVYTPDEIQAISEACKSHQIKLHLDGARFTNALVASDCSPAELTWKAGVDVLCLGATKNGAWCAEAVIFFNPELGKDFEHHRKRAGQLVSKGRLLGAQFEAWLDDDHWLDLAKHSNKQAQKLAKGLAHNTAVKIVYPTQANQVFAIIPKVLDDKLKQAGAQYYPWYLTALPAGVTLREDEVFIRLVTSFATTDAEVEAFLQIVNET